VDGVADLALAVRIRLRDTLSCSSRRRMRPATRPPSPSEAARLVSRANSAQRRGPIRAPGADPAVERAAGACHHRPLVRNDNLRRHLKARAIENGVDQSERDGD
jgi:hypothetical protein